MLITVALIVALVLAAVDEVRSRGTALTSWAVIIIAGVLLYARL